MDGFGSKELGHVNFYPNGGTSIQPGCSVGEILMKKSWKFTGISKC